MKDPFPIAPFPALSDAIRPWADYFHLPTLPLHIHEIVLGALFYQFVFSLVAPRLSSRLFPAKYAALSPSRRLNWNVHVVSFVQSTLINVLALWVMLVNDERRNMDWQERVWGYDGACAMIQALAAGYFLWDLIVTATNVSIFGPGMLAHAVSALLVYSLGFRPFVNYYSCNFILWELSSPFLNIHWFFDKLGMTGSRAQLYNGLMLIATFFSCRLVWGTYQSVMVARDVWSALHAQPAIPVSLSPDKVLNSTFPAQYAETMTYVSDSTSIPGWLAVLYILSNLTLNSLNFYWFFKMVDAVRKRFTPKEKAEPMAPMKGRAGETTGASTGMDEKARPRRRTILDGEDGDEPPHV
ncbi:Uu.00g014790.m01.CDS01 [Anthostomella pinea]|uniref:Uu.00g014790.m01.CDS01 n=1 Tax=Anthostomella pinea TaxID=933095 RepID=A0AAI8VYZ4_9PEZI|nr:Uu.00g014790.m01.CDS01 [Anthostomella pinea]